MKKFLLTLLFSSTACTIAAATSTGTPWRPPLQPEGLPRFVTQGTQPIACTTSPFGRYATMGEDAEYVSFVANTSTQGRVEVYAPGPSDGAVLLGEFSGDLLRSGGLAGSTFVTAIDADLNGDGRDELITAHRVGAEGPLRLGVFRRSGAGAVSLVQTWELTRNFS
jgi:hypothetical protein